MLIRIFKKYSPSCSIRRSVQYFAIWSKSQLKSPNVKSDEQPIYIKTSLSKSVAVKPKIQFQDLVLDFAMEFNTFCTRKNITQSMITDFFQKHQSKIVNQFPSLKEDELLHYICVAKNAILNKLLSLSNIDAGYKMIEQFLKNPSNAMTANRILANLWQDESSIHVKIRAISLFHYLNRDGKETYMKKIIQYVRFFKSPQIFMTLYECYRYNYQLSYEFLNCIHDNQTFQEITEINLAFLKMLFIEQYKGIFCPDVDGIFNRVLSLEDDQNKRLNRTEIQKIIYMIQSEIFFVQNQFSRFYLQTSLNHFIKIVTDQNYNQNTTMLEDLIEIYFGFWSANSSGEILLDQINYFSSNLQINEKNLPFFQKLVKSVTKNIQKTLKYELLDYLNKEYTKKSIKLLQIYIPKMISLWPEIILEVNNAVEELMDANMTSIFEKVFYQQILPKTSIALTNKQTTINILNFLITHKNKANYHIDPKLLQTLALEIQVEYLKGNRNPEHYEIFYKILIILEKELTTKQSLPEILRIYNEFICKQVKRISEEKSGFLNNLDRKLIYLCLCSAKLQEYKLDYYCEFLGKFINQKLVCLINSLQYEQVYLMLKFVLNYKGIDHIILEKLYFNLSTFIIYSNDHNTYYLNKYFLHLYPQILKLTIEHKNTLKEIHNKKCFSILQVILAKFHSQLTSLQILKLLEVIGVSQILTKSMISVLAKVQFLESDFKSIDRVILQNFKQFNPQISHKFDKTGNQAEINQFLTSSIKDTKLIALFFQNKYVYQHLLTHGNLNPIFHIPKPVFPDKNIQMMYFCEQAFQKIKKNNNFQQLSDRNEVKLVDLAAEKAYIIQRGVIEFKNVNEFHLSNLTLPTYFKMEVWKSYGFFEKSLDIEDISIIQTITDEVILKVVKSVFGNFEKIREVFKTFTYNHKLVNFLKTTNLNYVENGAFIEIFNPDKLETAANEKPEPIVSFISTFNQNYKILYICAYTLAIKGKNVIVLTEKSTLHDIKAYLTLKYPKLEVKETEEKKIKVEESAPSQE